MTGELIEPSETSVQTVCWWSTPPHARRGRRTVRGVNSGIDARGSMVALKCVARYLKGTSYFADLDTKTLAAKTLSLLRGLNGLVDECDA